MVLKGVAVNSGKGPMFNAFMKVAPTCAACGEDLPASLVCSCGLRYERDGGG